MTQILSNTEALEVITEYVQELRTEVTKAPVKSRRWHHLRIELEGWDKTLKFARKEANRQP